MGLILFLKCTHVPFRYFGKADSYSFVCRILVLLTKNQIFVPYSGSSQSYLLDYRNSLDLIFRSYLYHLLSGKY